MGEYGRRAIRGHLLEWRHHSMEQKPRRKRRSGGPSREAGRLLASLLRGLGVGEIRGKVRLENLEDRILLGRGLIAKEAARGREVEMVADTGAVVSLLPQDLVEDLGLPIVTRRIV